MLDELGIELIGASVEAIATAEDRERFAACMASVGLRCARSAVAHTVDEARQLLAEGAVRLPLVIRPAFTLGGQGGGFAATAEELDAVVARGVAASPISQVLVEESVKGWGEFELEVIRDRVDNVIVVCSIENLDPMGVHTGDSVCVAPAMTLSDREFQTLRDAAATVIRAVGVETGGSNVQFALERETGELVVIEMNPRVSRSSALASKATGYPIAKVATKLALGYTLDEIPNDLTGTTPASFEPTLDYVVVKAAALRVREVRGRRRAADDAHEERRRGDVHRPHLLRGVRQGAAQPRAGHAAAARGAGRRAAVGSLRHDPRAARAGRGAARRWRRSRASTRGSWTSSARMADALRDAGRAARSTSSTPASGGG